MIAIDALGGDNAPQVVLQAVLSAAKKGVPILLCGPEPLLEKLLSEQDPSWHTYPIILHHAPDFIEMDEEPVAAVRKKQQSSLVSTVTALAQGKASYAISAGNSGAFVVACSLILGRKQGIDRPALAGFLPTRNGFTLVLDLGANTEVRPQHLVQFAHLGAECTTYLTGIKTPKVALLANGHEERKGSAVTKEAYMLLSQEQQSTGDNKKFRFVGNIEPYHLYNHDADVVVCDGFAGNIMLKTMEAVFQLTHALTTQAFQSENYTTKEEKELVLAHAQQAFATVEKSLDHRKFGGAFVLGVKGNALVCHGGADAHTLENAIMLAFKGAHACLDLEKTVQN